MVGNKIRGEWALMNGFEFLWGKVMSEDDSFLICKRCFSKFNREGHRSSGYWLCLVGLIVLCKGLVSIYPGTLSPLIAAIAALSMLVLAMGTVLGFQKINKCPKCQSKELVPQSSVAGQELSEKAQVVETGAKELNDILKFSALVSGILGLVFIFIAKASGDKIMKAYEYKTCIEDADQDIESTEKEYKQGKRDFFASQTNNILLQKQQQSRKDCERLNPR